MDYLFLESWVEKGLWDFYYFSLFLGYAQICGGDIEGAEG